MDYKATLQSTVKNVPVQVQAVQSAGAPLTKWPYTQHRMCSHNSYCSLHTSGSRSLDRSPPC